VKRKLLCRWMGHSTQVLWVEEEIEGGILSCSDISLRDYYLVLPDGSVTDDYGDGNWYGVVQDWDYKGDA